MSKKLAVVDRSHCVACGACRKVCPKEAITIMYGVYAEADPALCVGCGKCVKECPGTVIALEVREG